MFYNRYDIYSMKGGNENMVVDKKKNTQVLVTIPHDLLEEIETYWHEKRLQNRNETIRELIKKGLNKQ